MKKRFLAMFLALVMCLALLPTAALAAEEFEMSGTTLVKYNGPGGDVVIPDSVTTIGQNAFWFCTSLTSVTIPNSVIKIEHDAFRDCTSLTSVTIPDSVITIEEGAFGHCPALTNVVIPNSVTVIEARMFFECTGLTSVVIPNSVATIGQNAFVGCKSLVSVTIPDSVTVIKSGAFTDCTSLTNVTIGKGVSEIGDAVFFGCTSLTSAAIPNGVSDIGKHLFRDCTNLTSVIIPASVTRIWDEAFFNCNSFKDVYYGGSEAQWKAITIDNYEDNNAPLFSASKHYNSTMPTSPTTPDKPVTPDKPAATAQANPTTQKLLVNGKEQIPAAYNINGSNYFKIRDLAALLIGTEKQFDVGYDDAAKAASIVPGQKYEKKPTDLQGRPTASGTAMETNDVFYCDGKQAPLGVYKVNNTNYVMLRDLAKLLDFFVDYDEAERSMIIDTTKPYTE